MCLGDAGAMTGHALPQAGGDARQARRGYHDAAHRRRAGAGEELTRRFGCRRWQFAMSATDANRFAIRFSRY